MPLTAEKIRTDLRA